MASKKHLEILQQGIETWNKWRNENPDIVPNLRNAYLYAADLEGADLWRANLKGATLERADLTFANLKEADLEGADLWGAKLKGANLKEANFSKATLRSADLEGADLTFVNLKEADLEWADLDRAKLKGANLKGANLEFAKLKGADLGEAKFTGANLKSADLTKADLYKTKLRSKIKKLFGGREAMTKKEEAESLIRVLSDIREDMHVRSDAARALGRVGNEIAVRPLINVLNCCEESSKDLQAAIISSLGEIRDGRAVPYLIDFLDNKELRDCALSALHKIRPEPELREPDREYQWEENLATLKNLSESTNIRKRAGEALLKIDYKRAVAPLTALLNDPIEEIRNFSHYVLETLNRIKTGPIDIEWLVREYSIWSASALKDAAPASKAGRSYSYYVGGFLQFRCGYCRRLHEAYRIQEVGTTITCKKCGKKLVVPSPSWKNVFDSLVMKVMQSFKDYPKVSARVVCFYDSQILHEFADAMRNAQRNGDIPGKTKVVTFAAVWNIDDVVDVIRDLSSAIITITDSKRRVQDSLIERPDDLIKKTLFFGYTEDEQVRMQ